MVGMCFNFMANSRYRAINRIVTIIGAVFVVTQSMSYQPYKQQNELLGTTPLVLLSIHYRSRMRSINQLVDALKTEVAVL